MDHDFKEGLGGEVDFWREVDVGVCFAGGLSGKLTLRVGEGEFWKEGDLGVDFDERARPPSSLLHLPLPAPPLPSRFRAQYLGFAIDGLGLRD